MSTAFSTTENPIKVGTKWQQQTRNAEGKILTRIVEVIAAPTLSTPVGVRIVRNDAHPHRKGKTTTLRAADLRRKYEAV